MKKKRIGLCLAVVLLIISVLSGCGSKSTNDMAKADVQPAAQEMGMTGGGIMENAEAASSEQKAGSEDMPVDLSERKLIKTVDLNVETQDFDNLLTAVEEKTAAFGGYIENLNTYNGSVYSGQRSERHANLLLRIPQDKLSDFLAQVEEAGNVVNRSEYVEDVTLTYVDLDSHKKALETEQARLLELLEKAESIEDIITIEQRLSEVRYQIESMASTLRTYDNKVDYSTVSMYISEVTKLSPVEEENAWERMGRGFINSLESVGNGLKETAIYLVVSIPYLVLAGIFVTAVLLIFYFIQKRRPKKNTDNNTKK